MNLASRNLRLYLGLLLAGLLLGPGCSPNGYITASVQSVIGLDVSENPQTQVPHIRFGFIRNQLYYIPTGKVVVQGGPAGSGKASETPELVSEINVEMEFLHTGKIHEKFAVGPVAVDSDPAQKLFNPEGKSVVTVNSTPRLSQLQRKIRVIIQDENKLAIAKNWLKDNFKNDPNVNNPDRWIDNPPEPAEQNLANLLNRLS